MTSVLAVHAQFEPIVSVNGNAPPRAETNVGSIVPAVHEGLGDGDGEGDGNGDGDGLGEGTGDGAAPVSCVSLQAPSTSTNANGASGAKEKRVIS